MNTIAEVPYFTPQIYEIGRGEEAKGGPLGNANIAPQQLACRTQWLKSKVEELETEAGAAPDQRTYTDNFTVTAQNMSDKFVTLSHIPAFPDKVELSVFGGIEQRPGVDFVVIGTTLSWNALALELLLDIDTAFTVRYSAS